MLGAISLDLFAVLLGGATALLPIYARDILIIGPWGLGVAAHGAGGRCADAVALFRAPPGAPARRARSCSAPSTSFGIATIVFGLSHWIVLSFLALVVLGASDVVSVVIRSSMVAIMTPDAVRGRVNAVNSLFIGTSNQAGEFESGVTAALLGPVGAVVLGGIGTVLVAIVCFRLFPDLANVDSLEDLRPKVSPLASNPAPASLV